MNFPSDFEEQYFLYNGLILPIDQFKNTLTEGENIIYEVIRVKDSAPLFLTEHLERFRHSADAMGYRINLEAIKGFIGDLLNANPVQQKNLRLMFNLDKNGHDNLLLYFIPSKYPTAEEKLNGVRMEVMEAERINPTVKFENKALRAVANEILSTQGCYDVLLADHDGLITEGSRSNVFFIHNDQLLTAPDHRVLGGITRQKVLEILKELHIPLIYRCIHVTELSNITGCFITGTSPGVLPVSRIGKQLLPAVPHVTRMISNKYEQMVQQSIDTWKKST